MKEVFYTIGDFFGLIFNAVEVAGDKLNFFFIGLIFILLIVWIAKMLKYRKDNKEHAPL